jgi:hypothetical protein
MAVENALRHTLPVLKIVGIDRIFYRSGGCPSSEESGKEMRGAESGKKSEERN